MYRIVFATSVKTIPDCISSPISKLLNPLMLEPCLARPSAARGVKCWPVDLGVCPHRSIIFSPPAARDLIRSAGQASALYLRPSSFVRAVAPYYRMTGDSTKTSPCVIKCGVCDRAGIMAWKS